MSEHAACLLYGSKRNNSSAAIIQGMAADCMLKKSPPIPFNELIKKEEFVGMKNRFLNEVSLARS